MKSISKFILFNILGWKVPIDFPSHIDKYIIIAAPHTSNWDFPIAVYQNTQKEKTLGLLVSTPCLSPPLVLLSKHLAEHR